MNRRPVISLVVSAVVAIGVPIYAMSLDEWGDTGAIMFPLAFVVAVLIVVASGVQLARSRR